MTASVDVVLALGGYAEEHNLIIW